MESSDALSCLTEVLEITRPEGEGKVGGGRGKCLGAATSQVAQVLLSWPTNPVRRSFFWRA